MNFHCDYQLMTRPGQWAVPGQHGTVTMGHVPGQGRTGPALPGSRAVPAWPESPPTSPSTTWRHAVPPLCYAGLGMVQLHCAKKGGRDRGRTEGHLDRHRCGRPLPSRGGPSPSPWRTTAVNLNAPEGDMERSHDHYLPLQVFMGSLPQRPRRLPPSPSPTSTPSPPPSPQLVQRRTWRPAKAGAELKGLCAARRRGPLGPTEGRRPRGGGRGEHDGDRTREPEHWVRTRELQGWLCGDGGWGGGE